MSRAGVSARGKRELYLMQELVRQGKTRLGIANCISPDEDELELEGTRTVSCARYCTMKNSIWNWGGTRPTGIGMLYDEIEFE